MRGILSTVGAFAAILSVAAMVSAGQQTTGKEKREKMIATPSGLRYIDLRVGDGRNAELGDTAIVHYTGWLENGTKFDSSLDRNEPFSFRIGQGMVIKGWDEGVSSMKKGGKRRLIIPPHLGYGTRGVGNIIPPNATLMFEVELLDLR